MLSNDLLKDAVFPFQLLATSIFVTGVKCKTTGGGGGWWCQKVFLPASTFPSRFLRSPRAEDETKFCIFRHGNSDSKHIAESFPLIARLLSRVVLHFRILKIRASSS